MRAKQAAYLDARRRRQNLQPEHLDPASRRPATSADEHGDQKQRRGKAAPGREIGAPVARAGHDRNSVEAGLPDCHGDRHAVAAQIPDQDHDDRRQKRHEPAHLRVLQKRLPAAANNGKVMGERQAADNHAGNHDPFDGHGIKRRDRGGAG